MGYQFIGPEEGWLACRHVGKGRMSDAQKIVGHIEEILSRR
jgi:phosphopantothenoylcysteine synthetase/decarboxylase